MKKAKIDAATLLTIGGFVLTLVGNGLKSIAEEKKTKELIAELVQKELESK